jgi:signal transduction histidine kinase
MPNVLLRFIGFNSNPSIFLVPFFKDQIKKLTLIICIGVFSISTFAQTIPQLDSLEKSLETGLEKDNQVQILGHLVAGYSQIDSSLTVKYLGRIKDLIETNDQRAVIIEADMHFGRMLFEMGYYPESEDVLARLLQESRVHQFLTQEAKLLHWLGKLENERRNYDLALNYATQYLEMVMKMKDTIGMSMAYQDMAAVYQRKGSRGLAIDYLIKSQNLEEGLANDERMAGLLRKIGNSYYSLGNSVKAIDYYFKALRKSEQAQSDELMAKCYNNLGYAYREQGDNNQALVYLKKAVLLNQEIKDRDLAALHCNILWNIGSTYQNLSDYENASEAYHEAFNLASKWRKKKFIGMSQNRIGRIQLLTDSLISAKESLTSAKTILKHLEANGELAISLINLGELNLKMHNYKLAADYLTQSIVISKELNLLAPKRDAYKLLYQVHEQAGDYKAAFENFQMFKQSSDSLKNEESVRRNTQMAMEYEQSQRQHEREQQQREKDILSMQKLEYERAFSNVLIFVAILLLIATLISFQAYYGKKRANKEIIRINRFLESQKEDLKKALATKDLFFKIISHDLRAPFSGLIGLPNLLLEKNEEYTTEERAEIIQLMINSASQAHDLSENLLQWALSQTGEIKLTSETCSIKELIILEFANLGDKAIQKHIDLRIETDESLQVKCDMDATRTILRNLITNAIKYSYSGSSVVVRIKREGAIVIVCIEDKGIGMTQDQKDRLFKIVRNGSVKGTNDEKGTGLGLILCKELVELQGGNIWAESEKGKGSKFSFTLKACGAKS